MIISEKQIMQLITIANAYIQAMHSVCEYRNAEIAQDLLAQINGQQSCELKKIEQ
jgi:hypothetical protein